MILANEWKDYKIIDMADGQKLEKWGNITLSRPDPQIIWTSKSYPEKWKKAENENVRKVKKNIFAVKLYFYY